MVSAVAEPPVRARSREAISLVRPLALGLSIGHPLGPSGCLGPFVRLQDGRMGFLSALHVLAPAKARDGDFIHQPSPVDGLATGESRIAQLVAPAPLSETGATVGVAAAVLLPDMEWQGNVLPESQGQAIASPSQSAFGAEEPVFVIGRTGVTQGRVRATNLSPLAVMTPQGPATFVDCLELIGLGGQPLTAPGDAGALVCRERDLSAMAMVFAVGQLADHTEATYALPLAPAMAALGAAWA